MTSHITDQPEPTESEHPAVWPLVIMDMMERDQVGRERYGTPLKPFNGRDMLIDSYMEVLDQAVYLRGAIYEREEAWQMIKSISALFAGKEFLGKEDTAKVAGLLQALLKQSHV